MISSSNATAAEQRAIVASVDRVLEAKTRDGSADTSSLKREIDALVAALGGLDEDEKSWWVWRDAAHRVLDVKTTSSSMR